MVGPSCWGEDHAGPRDIPGAHPSLPLPFLAPATSDGPQRNGSQRRSALVPPPGLCRNPVSGWRRPVGAGRAVGQACLLQSHTRARHPGAMDGGKGPSADPKPVSAWHHSTGIAPNPWAVATQFLPAAAHSPRVVHCLPQKAALENHWERAQSPTHPPQPGPTCLRGDVRKGPRELLMIQRAFSTDAFGWRGLQVSTWFGFGSPPPFQTIRLSARSIPHGCRTCARHKHHLLWGETETRPPPTRVGKAAR